MRNEDWLLQVGAPALPGQPDPTRDRDAFTVRCSARERERQLGTGYGFGIFVDGAFAGEINLNSVQRGPFQNAYVGYWIDEARAGNGYMPESVVVLTRFAFEELRLHRLQIAIIPRNAQQPAGDGEAGSAARRASPSATSRSTGCGRTTSATPSRPRSGTRGATELAPLWLP